MSGIWYVPWEELAARRTTLPLRQSARTNSPSDTALFFISSPSVGLSPTIKDEALAQLATRKPKAKRRKQKQPAKDREALLAAVAAYAPRQTQWIKWLRSASVERMKFQATFIELFFDRQGSRFPGFEYILRSADQTPALITALDAICLVHVGTTHSDERLLEAARMTYGSALAKVRREILASERDASLLVAAVYLLTICEFFSATAAPDEGWRRHIRGILQLLGSLDLASLDPSIRILLGTLLRGPAVWWAISARKRLPSLSVIQHALDDGTTFSSSTDFIKLAIRVPTIIERVDILRDADPSPSISELAECCLEIAGLGNHLQAWMNSWVESLDEKPFRVLPVSAITKSRAKITTEGTVFPFAYHFISPLLAPKHRSYWTCMLALAQAHLDLFEAFPEHLAELQSHNHEMAQIISTATEFADKLCMTIAFDTQPENGYVALFSAMIPLEFAAMWYQRRNFAVKLEWCRQAMQIFRLAGLQTSKP